MSPNRRMEIAKSCLSATRARMRDDTLDSSAKAALDNTANVILMDAGRIFDAEDIGSHLRDFSAALERATAKALLGEVKRRVDAGELTTRDARSFLIFIGELDYHYSDYRAGNRTAAEVLRSIQSDSRSRWAPRPATGDVLSAALISDEFAPTLEKLGQMRDSEEHAKIDRQRAADEAATKERASAPDRAKAALEAQMTSIRGSEKLTARYEELDALLAHFIEAGSLDASAKPGVLQNLRVLQELSQPQVDPVGLYRAAERGAGFQLAPMDILFFTKSVSVLM